MIRDILLPLTSYPDPTSPDSVKSAVNFGASMGAKMSAMSFQTHTKMPRTNRYLADMVLDIPGIAAREIAVSCENAKQLLQAFALEAKRLAVFEDATLKECPITTIPDLLTAHARLHDLTIIPMQNGDAVEQWYAESIIFGSGRPIILLPKNFKAAEPCRFDTVVVAWDSGRAAARALADAIPIVKMAGKVKFVTVENEKHPESFTSNADLVASLQRQGISIEIDRLDADGRRIGPCLEAYVQAQKADLLVMGAFGHSRALEFILGGATQSMISSAPVPVFLSH